MKLKFDPTDNIIAPHIAAYGAWQPATKELLERVLEPDWTFLDLGANIGYFSLLASPRCRWVYAVEPVCYDLLETNVRQANVDNVITLGWAAWDKDDALLKAVTPDAGNPGGTYMVEASDGSILGKELSHCTARLPEVIKWDIEGAEYRVMKAPSSQPYLEAAKYMVVEFAPTELRRTSSASLRDLYVLLLSYGFGLFDELGRFLTDVPYVPEGMSTNIVAIKGGTG